MDIDKMIEESDFSPIGLGIKILESHGYKVDKFGGYHGTMPSIYVYDKDDPKKLLYYCGD